MNQFFAPIIKDTIAILSEAESLHLRVLRVKEGDQVNIVDGYGHRYSGRISKMHKKATEVANLTLTERAENPPLLDIAIAPTKSNDRFEWFLEKSTELGIRNIYPLLTFHSERKVLKLARMQKIILSAMKQSLRLWQPTLHEMQSLDRFLANADLLSEQNYIAHLKENTQAFTSLIQTNKSCLLMIGPEGGFSDDEIEKAESKGFKGVSLGEKRYRTETAGMLACALFGNS
ncbi:MAG: 16S rRNA (uracil(1498)-N(3))-methyltransferase [Flavobacteriaceae bacterium]|nr:MAG: 16S rRNA (uracil(1498)-N(3))-methyltransferase [Flavobacteriaceae bacterium]